MQLYGFYTQNTLKTLYVLEEVGNEFEFIFTDLSKGEHKTDDFLKIAPIGKVPVLRHKGETISESGAICRYVANEADSALYPGDKMARAKVDQWMDFFSNHLGRWLSGLLFEKVIKLKFDMGEPSEEACEEAVKFAGEQFAFVNRHLGENVYFTGEALSIADLCAFAYIEQVHAVDFSLAEFPHVKAWYDNMEALESIARARGKAGL